MDPAAKGNVLMYLSAMCALGTVWMLFGAFGDGGVLYGVIAVLLAAASVIAFRAYRNVSRGQ